MAAQFSSCWMVRRSSVTLRHLEDEDRPFLRRPSFSSHQTISMGKAKRIDVPRACAFVILTRYLGPRIGHRSRKPLIWRGLSRHSVRAYLGYTATTTPCPCAGFSTATVQCTQSSAPRSPAASRTSPFTASRADSTARPCTSGPAGTASDVPDPARTMAAGWWRLARSPLIPLHRRCEPQSRRASREPDAPRFT